MLQEAQDPEAPLADRLRFVAIYSSLLDEFFRVRVAYLRGLARLGEGRADEFRFDPTALLRRIHEIVGRQQEALGKTFRGPISRALRELGIRLIRDDELDDAQRAFVSAWFTAHVAGRVSPMPVGGEAPPPVMKDGQPYLLVILERGGGWRRRTRTALVEIPSGPLPRFLRLPEQAGTHGIMLLDDVVRCGLPELFPGERPVSSHSVKLSRDAELHLDDGFDGDLIDEIKRSLEARQWGEPSRLLHAPDTPARALAALRRALALPETDLVEGDRYHNWRDFEDLPLLDRPGLRTERLRPLAHPAFRDAGSIFETLDCGDVMLHFPYHSYEPVVRYLEEAARDPAVESIDITLYRLASDSRIARALIEAARRGKSVAAFVEVGARFDEEANIQWGEELEKAGANVLYRRPRLKVHAKLCLISRREGGGLRRYAYLSTGNFNEQTARSYCDDGLFTRDDRIVGDVVRVFEFLRGRTESPHFEALLVAPFTLRARLLALVDAEIRAAHSGRPASILLKVNAVEDRKLIAKLYEASRAGVRIRIIVRGICCLRPGVPGLSENIEAISILDQFLEHARIYRFHNGGNDRWFLASADWMHRNMRRRVEVAIPIFAPELRAELEQIVELQWGDARKARVIDAAQTNAYRDPGPRTGPGPQRRTYDLLKDQGVEPWET